MFTSRSFKRCRRRIRFSVPRQSAVTVEGLEHRFLFAFNAYIAGVPSGVQNQQASFTFSTTREAAKQWVIDWGDATTTTLPAPDAGVGFLSPQVVTHAYQFRGDYPVTAVATSVTNATANAALALNSAWTGQGTGGGAGKTVDGLRDGTNVGTSICATVVDDVNRSYVLSVDGKRMAVTRFTATGQLDTACATNGTFVLASFTSPTIQDTPRAMTIDAANHILYVAGGSNNKWAVSRIDIDSMPNPVQLWPQTLLTGTATGLWLDTTDGKDRIGIAGTSAGNEIQMAMLYAVDVGDPLNDPAHFHHAGSYTDFANGVGYATAPNTIYGIDPTNTVWASSAAVVVGDDNDIPTEDWFVSGTVNYCSSATSHASDMVVVDFTPDGTTRSGWGNGNGAALFNTEIPDCIMGSNLDSNFAMVADGISLTLVGTGSDNVVTERFTADKGKRDVGGDPTIPTAPATAPSAATAGTSGSPTAPSASGMPRPRTPSRGRSWSPAAAATTTTWSCGSTKTARWTARSARPGRSWLTSGRPPARRRTGPRRSCCAAPTAAAATTTSSSSATPSTPRPESTRSRWSTS
jgi:hypothetical protein